jgi:hypothetical protein
MGEPNITIPDEAVYEAWSEFRYPRAALDEPSEGFMRAIRALNTRLPHIVAAELDRLASALNEHADAVHTGDPAAGVFSGGLMTGASKLTNRAAELRGRVGSLTHKNGETQ